MADIQKTPKIVPQNCPIIMNKKFSPVVKQIITQSGAEARRLGHDYIGVEHLLLGIIAERDSLPVRVLDALLVDVHDLKKRLERAIPRYSAYPPADDLFVGEFQVTTQVQRVLKVTFLEARMLKSEEIFPEHLMLSLLKHSDAVATKLLNEYDVDYDTFKKELEYVRSEQDLTTPGLFNQAEGSGDYDDDDERGYRSASSSTSGSKSQQKSRTPVLDNFGRDITKLAEEGRLDPIIGRETEIERVSQILSRRKKNNPILIGEPGVGKTAIVEGLALRIMQKR